MRHLHSLYSGLALAIAVGALAWTSGSRASSQSEGATEAPPSQQAPAAPSAEQGKDTTIRNLQSAAQGEANAANRYELFAQKADEEGYGQVAKLFRAAALSERVHLRNHQDVLRSLGVSPEPTKLETVQVGSTQENLRVPIEGEREEATTMYPKYAEAARAAGIQSAARTFTYAGETEQHHLKLFEDALAKLGNNPSADYLVQSESGMLTVQSPSRVASVVEPSTG